MLPETIEIVNRLEALANPENVAGMARYGINPQGTLGISIYTLRTIAKELRKQNAEKNHPISLELWDTGIHEARILASFLDSSSQVTETQMESWVKDIDSWDICDQVCSNLFDRTSFAYPKAFEWSERDEEFVKRAGFVLMASLAVHDKRASDEQMAKFFPLIVRESSDERNFVKKAVNWALRNLGKRNQNLNLLAIDTAKRIQEIPSRAARWIASDALRELTSEKVQEKLGRLKISH